MNLLNKLFVFLFLFLSFYTEANEYFTNKLLSAQSVSFALGAPIYRPIKSFKNTFAKELMVQMDYRMEHKEQYVSSVFRGQIEFDLQAQMESVSAYSGLRVPHLHRQTPFYFGVLLGVGFSKGDTKWPVYLNILSSYRLIQFTKKTSALVEVGVQYMLRKDNWWRRPSSISLFTVVDFNI